MVELSGGLGEFRMTIEVKRAETGKTETFDLIGKVVNDDTSALDNGA